MSKKFKFKSAVKKKINFLGENSDVIGAEMLNGAHIELFGNSKILIEGCSGISDYGEDYIKLKVGKISLIICGSGFDILYFENGSINIKGTVLSLEFCV